MHFIAVFYLNNVFIVDTTIFHIFDTFQFVRFSFAVLSHHHIKGTLMTSRISH